VQEKWQISLLEPLKLKNILNPKCKTKKEKIKKHFENNDISNFLKKPL